MKPSGGYPNTGTKKSTDEIEIITTPTNRQHFHPSLAAGRWFTFSLAEQLANIGSEYERAFNWKKRNNLELFQKAFDRMLELIDLTLEDPRWKYRLKELTRLREEACRLIEPELPVSDLRKYFMQFALLARQDK